MAKTFAAPFVQSSALSAALFTNSDGTTAKTLVTSNANDTRLETLSATNDDTVARVVRLYLFDGATTYPIGAVSVPAGAGIDGTNAAKDLLNELDMPAVAKAGALVLKSGWQLRVGMSSSVAAGKTVSVFHNGGDY